MSIHARAVNPSDKARPVRDAKGMREVTFAKSSYPFLPKLKTITY